MLDKNIVVGTTQSLFTDRNIAIASMHSKEEVIAPLLKNAFGCSISVPEIDTDVFGTFSGEIERIHSPLDAAKHKCILAIESSNCDIAIASEGSFGMHPFIPFAIANEEIVLLYDQRNDLTIYGKALSTNTNFNGKVIYKLDQALEFAKDAGFPNHGLIIRESKDSQDILKKGLTDDTFESLVHQQLEINGEVWVETDMRANFNPTRMKVIEEATQNLTEKMLSQCPNCSFPGFWVKELIDGLPCQYCGRPTKSVLKHIYKCDQCHHSKSKVYPNGKKFQDPMYCDYCNP